MLQLNDTKCDFGKFVLEYNKTLIDEMETVCFPHLPRGYSRSDLLPTYLCALENYYERLKKKNSKKIVINLRDRNYKRFITKVIDIFYAMSVVKRQ